MIIDVWFDFSCPFCYMAHTNLLKAFENKKSEDVNIRYNTFELFPAQFTNKPENFTESFARKYNRTVDEAKTLLENMEKKAKSFGLNIDVNKLYEVNTKKAHILLQYAKTHDICEKYVQNVFNAYFNGENIDDEEVLIKALKSSLKIQNR